MIPSPSTIVTAYGFAMLSARMAIAMAPTSSAGTTGTRRVPDTDASLSPAGRLLSRAMANRIRTDIAWMARQQPKIASAQYGGEQLVADRQRPEQDQHEAHGAGRGHRLDDRPRSPLARVVRLLGQ